MINFFFKIKNTFFLDKNEKKFRTNLLKYKIKNYDNKNNQKTILFNASENYYDVCFSYLLTKEKKYKKFNLLFYIPFFSFHKKNFEKNFLNFTFSFYLNNLILIFRNLRWKRLFSTINNNFVSLNNFNIFTEIRLMRIEKKKLSKVKSKKDIHNLKFKGIKIGDLLYDTYLRYKNVPTININDSFLIEIYAKILFSYPLLKQLKNSYKIEYFFTNQLSYIHHGLPSRFFVNNKIKVKYFGGKAAYLSDHKLKNYWHSHDFRNFPKIFKKLKDKKNKIKSAKKLLEKKFSGKIIPQENFILKESAYKNKNEKLKNFLGVIFLHCFVDAPTGRGNCLFNDFYEWTDETLSFFEKNNLSKYIAIKPHPNSRDISIATELKFKKKYQNFIWLNKKTSNKSIFKKKPKFGISVLGSVLPEIAYHGIFCISASTHPSMAYNFVYRPKTKKDYFQKLIEISNSKNRAKIKSKNKIYEYIYCDYIKDDNKELLARKMKLKDLNFTKSNVLQQFINKTKEVSDL